MDKDTIYAWTILSLQQYCIPNISKTLELLLVILYAVTAVDFKQDIKDIMCKITRGLITKKITKRITHHKRGSP